jgi:hypothetical protein
VTGGIICSIIGVWTRPVIVCCEEEEEEKNSSMVFFISSISFISLIIGRQNSRNSSTGSLFLDVPSPFLEYGEAEKVCISLMIQIIIVVILYVHHIRNKMHGI